MPNPSKEQFVVKLSVEEYRDFAKWMTAEDPSDNTRRRYQIPESGNPANRLSTLASNELNAKAEIYEDCAQSSQRKWNKDTDSLVIERDDKVNKRYPMAVPEVICEDQYGKIDLQYLKSYVTGLCNMNSTNPDDAAYALLGMYFLSRCR